MKLKSFFLTTLAALSLLSFPGCEQEAKLVPKIQVDSEMLTVAPEGGSCSFSYSLENPVADETLEVDTEAEWIRDFDLGTAGKVSFTADENRTGAQRSADILLSYPGAQSVLVQAVQTSQEIHFEISLDKVTATTIAVTVTPADETMKYIPMLSDKASMEGFEDDDVLFEDVMNYFQQQADKYGTTLDEVLASFQVTGTQPGEFKKLEPDTDYVFYCFGMSDDKERITPVERMEIRTKVLETTEISFDFDIDVNEEEVSASVTCTPTNEDVSYLFKVISRTEYEYNSSSVAWYVRVLLNTYVYGGYGTMAEVVDMLTDSGVQSAEVEGEPNMEYVAFALVLDEEGNVVSEVAEEWFEIPGKRSDNVITLELGEITGTSVQVKATASNQDGYYIGVEPANRVEGMEDDYLMWSLIDYYSDFETRVASGNREVTFDGLQPDSQYYALAFGYADGSYTTDLVKIPFSTKPAGSGADCTFEFTVSNLKPRGAVVTVNPSDPSVAYYWDLYRADQDEEEIRAYLQSLIDQQIAAGSVADAAEFWKYSIFRGQDSYEFPLNPESSYHAVAVAIDLEAGDYAGEFQFSDVFTTPEAILSDVTIEATFDKYFDGDELYELDPSRFQALVGKAYLELTATITAGEAQHYYYQIFAYKEGYEKPEVFPDETVIYNLVDMNRGVVDRPMSQFIIPWDTDLLICAVAVDSEGNYGKVYRQKFNLDREGAAPIEDFNGAPARTGVPFLKPAVCTPAASDFADFGIRLNR